MHILAKGRVRERLTHLRSKEDVSHQAHAQGVAVLRAEQTVLGIMSS